MRAERCIRCRVVENTGTTDRSPASRAGTRTAAPPAAQYFNALKRSRHQAHSGMLVPNALGLAQYYQETHRSLRPDDRSGTRGPGSTRVITPSTHTWSGAYNQQEKRRALGRKPRQLPRSQVELGRAEGRVETAARSRGAGDGEPTPAVRRRGGIRSSSVTVPNLEEVELRPFSGARGTLAIRTSRSTRVDGSSGQGPGSSSRLGGRHSPRAAAVTASGGARSRVRAAARGFPIPSIPATDRRAPPARTDAERPSM